MARDFDAEISAAEAKLRSQLEVADQRAQDVIAAIAAHAADWYTQYVQESVKRYPEITKGLGVEKLGELKKELATLAAEAPSAAAKLFVSPGCWWHRDGKNSGEAYAFVGTDVRDVGTRIPVALAPAYRELFSRLGPLLEKYGYRSPKAGPFRSASEFMRDQPERLKSALRAYAVAFKKGVEEAQQDLARLKREKEVSEAEDLWKKA